MYTNVDGFLNKKDEFELRFCTTDLPDVIVLTEVIPKRQQYPIVPGDMKLEGFQDPIINFKLHAESPGKEVRGIAVYVRNCIGDVEQLSVTSGLIECVGVSIRLTRSERFTLVAMYRSPSLGGPESTREVCKVLEEVCKSNPDHILVVGDFNYPEIDWVTKESKQGPKHHTNLFIETVQVNLLDQHIKQPTRVRSGQTPSLLDLVLSYEDQVEDIVYQAPVGSSDHAVLLFNATGMKTQGRQGAPQVNRNFNKGNYEMAKTMLQETDWSILYRGSIEDAWTFFKTRLQEICEEVIPEHKKKKRSIYMNREAFKQKQKKDQAFLQYQKHPTEDNSTKYKRERNQLRALTRRLRKSFEEMLASELKKNPKPFWRYCNSRLKNRSKVGRLTKPDGTKTEDTAEMVTELNSFFSSVFTEEDLQVLPTPERVYTQSLETMLITEERVKLKLNNLKTSKTPGPDNVHPRLLRETAEDSCVPLTILFNRSLDSGELPEDWRLGNITPIHKKGDKGAAQNYRPVSLTSQVSKIMESLIRDDMMAFFMDIGVLSDEQHGFVPGRSCVSQLLLAFEEWTRSLDEGAPVDVLYLDFRKAFDSVAHKRLLITLNALGIRGKLLTWIQGFLTGRKQRVVLEGTASEWVDVASGVPQGSVLGPTLFIAAVQSMPMNVNSSILIYADDTKVYRPVSSRAEADALQEDLDALTAWSTRWQLPFNCTKCKVMHLGGSNAEHDYFMLGHLLETTTVEKDLGLLVENTLQFHSQTSSVVSRGFQTLGIIKRSFLDLNETTLPLLFKTMVRPILEFGNCVWGPLMCGDQDKVERVQRRATKMVASIRHLPYQDRLQRLKLPSLHYRRMRGDMILVFQIVTGRVRLEPSKLFIMAPAESSTRGHSLKLSKPAAARVLRHNFFSVRIVNPWNSLPEQVVTATSINTFKNRLDKHWQHRMYELRGEP